MATKDEVPVKQEISDIQPKQKKAEVQTNEKTKGSQQLIYIGPTLPNKGAILKQNQVFQGGYPTHLEGLYTEYPHLKSLFVPVEQFKESQKKINQTGSLLNMALRSLKGE